MKKIVEQVWDYTKHAKFYEYRPNYAPATIDMLVALMQKNQKKEIIKVADIGAGTGNLSIMLLERGCEVVSVEPNDAMREIGVQRTKDQKIEWVRATGIDSTLQSGVFDWVAFGSSFNVMDRVEALKESYRLLKPKSYFSCMWNHRDLNDPIQKIAEESIIEFVPNYTRGVRREDQRPIIESHKELFDNIIYIEEDFYFHQSLENYINAWRSVKNPYWDLETKEGEELFGRIAQVLEQRLPKEFDIKYTTRCWSAKKV
ncbi:class I SAM-dependent methyltransferase [Helicobacter canadensis]|uniref:Methyltransferase n=1 Tax=Helicobacter canadensis MIT 98-5491 TaxID=537970 RepID=C5ZZC8_9HELI|nr:class I SAM-dependent methyltransferase [Helicobacter canadensis]EES89386.1 putative methyltransferase [Helicobacter canadensis MIT 98-5491]EFR48177.1 methyltransferase domain protein [Helicobacter canadensis MIT 98-5491]STO99423.1 ubiquinone/menaquinone biosynthesis methyltransferase [Helicobacter canadensis]